MSKKNNIYNMKEQLLKDEGIKIERLKKVIMLIK